MLRIHGLKREVNGRAILTEINFSVKPGETLFVRGPSGVGKSLLLRSVAYLDPIQVVMAVKVTVPYQGRSISHCPSLVADKLNVMVMYKDHV